MKLLKIFEETPEIKIRLFIKPYCPWCHKAQHWLDECGGNGFDNIPSLD